jgi:hypothetical protein
VKITNVREINSPIALATFGAFFVPEPLGGCLVVAAAVWWSSRKLKSIDLKSLMKVGRCGGESATHVALEENSPKKLISVISASEPTDKLKQNTFF